MKIKVLLTGLGASLLVSIATAAPFGGTKDVAYADNLWQVMLDQRFAGTNAIHGTPYKGMPPHGAILDTIEGEVSVGDNTGILIVKRNYGGEGVNKTAVANDPSKYLKAITVMYKRSGYDAENKDWFWVKYKPDGSLHTNAKGMPLAGQIAKGMPTGCLSCHLAAPGGDLVFNHDRFKD